MNRILDSIQKTTAFFLAFQLCLFQITPQMIPSAYADNIARSVENGQMQPVIDPEEYQQPTQPAASLPQDETNQFLEENPLSQSEGNQEEALEEKSSVEESVQHTEDANPSFDTATESMRMTADLERQQDEMINVFRQKYSDSQHGILVMTPEEYWRRVPNEQPLIIDQLTYSNVRNAGSPETLYAVDHVTYEEHQLKQQEENERLALISEHDQQMSDAFRLKYSDSERGISVMTAYQYEENGDGVGPNEYYRIDKWRYTVIDRLYLSPFTGVEASDPNHLYAVDYLTDEEISPSAIEEPVVPIPTEEPVAPIQVEEPTVPTQLEEPVTPVQEEEPVVPVQPEGPAALTPEEIEANETALVNQMGESVISVLMEKMQEDFLSWEIPYVLRSDLLRTVEINPNISLVSIDKQNKTFQIMEKDLKDLGVFTFSYNLDGTIYLNSTPLNANLETLSHVLHALQKGVRKKYIIEMFSQYGPDGFFFEALMRAVAIEDHARVALQTGSEIIRGLVMPHVLRYVEWFYETKHYELYIMRLRETPIISELASAAIKVGAPIDVITQDVFDYHAGGDSFEVKKMLLESEIKFGILLERARELKVLITYVSKAYRGFRDTRDFIVYGTMLERGVDIEDIHQDILYAGNEQIIDYFHLYVLKDVNAFYDDVISYDTAVLFLREAETLWGWGRFAMESGFPFELVAWHLHYAHTTRDYYGTGIAFRDLLRYF